MERSHLLKWEVAMKLIVLGEPPFPLLLFPLFGRRSLRLCNKVSVAKWLCCCFISWLKVFGSRYDPYPFK